MKNLPMICLVLTAMLASNVLAKRSAPKSVAPVVHNGVSYTASAENGLEGKIEARNVKTGEKLWDVVIYTIKPIPDLEEDVQWVFITELAIRDNSLLVTNEKNRQFRLDLTTRKVEEVKKEEKKAGF